MESQKPTERPAFSLLCIDLETIFPIGNSGLENPNRDIIVC